MISPLRSPRIRTRSVSRLSDSEPIRGHYNRWQVAGCRWQEVAEPLPPATLVHSQRGALRGKQIVFILGELRDGGVEILSFVLGRIRQDRNVLRLRIELQH